MKTAELILEARRVLGDTAGQRWSDERLLDIFNRGMRDIARHGNMYRKETIIELMKGRKRYPLPDDILKITSVYQDNVELPIKDGGRVSKSQINLGILEINPAYSGTRLPRMFDGEVGAFTAVSSTDGVASNPVHSVFGVTSSLTVTFDKQNKQPFGIITGTALRKDEKYVVHYTGSSYGVITDISMSSYDPDAPSYKGGYGEHRDTFRLVGTYGGPVSALYQDEFIQVMYKALPPKVQTLDYAFPLSSQYEDLLVDWIVGTALQDDNDAGNQQRSQVFIQRYIRNLEAVLADSVVDYNRSDREVPYNGGIVKKRRRRR